MPERGGRPERRKQTTEPENRPSLFQLTDHQFQRRLFLTSIRSTAKALYQGLHRAALYLLDRLPGFIADPLDWRFKQFALGIQSVRTDWDLESMKGMRCARSIWLGHAAFAHALVLHRKPKVIVDLGVFEGCSTFAMGLALKRLGSGKIYAVDSWQGDMHIGNYNDRVYRVFLEQRDALGLRDYVIPMKMLFSEAHRIVNEQVDILHVDGIHTFRAARSDFLLFRDHLAPGAVVMFHDVYNNEFPSMHILWKYLSMQYRSHRLEHSSGLGLILARGGDRNLGLESAINAHKRIEAIQRRISENLQGNVR